MAKVYGNCIVDCRKCVKNRPYRFFLPLLLYREGSSGKETVDSKNMGVNTIKEGFQMKFVEHVHAQSAGGTFQWKHD